MEKIILKTSLGEDQILARNNMECDGIELQMFQIDESFENVEKTNHKIHTIHIPFMDNYCHLNVLINQDISKLRRVFEFALKKEAGIVMHCCDFPITKCDQQKLRAFVSLVNEYNGLKVAVENTTRYNSFGEDRTLDVIEDCNYMNKLSSQIHFYPLLDICHMVSNLNTTITYRGYDIAYALSYYNSEWYNIHFNYAFGDGQDERHGVPFNGNLILLEQILNYLKKHDLHPNLIIEVKESDYITCPNANRLARQIRDIYQKLDKNNK